MFEVEVFDKKLLCKSALWLDKQEKTIFTTIFTPT